MHKSRCVVGITFLQILSMVAHDIVIFTGWVRTDMGGAGEIRVCPFMMNNIKVAHYF